MQPLTYDEQKAAEAAFRGRPPESSWSERALSIYHGIIAQTNGRDIVEAMNANEEELTTLVGAVS